MEKEENLKTENETSSDKGNDKNKANENIQSSDDKKIDEEISLEEASEKKIIDLEDKLARTFAEMENQRRRFEKEKEEAYEYGGYAFAKEALNLIDNLERSKKILENDESLKNSEAQKKNVRTF